MAPRAAFSKRGFLVPDTHHRTQLTIAVAMPLARDIVPHVQSDS